MAAEKVKSVLIIAMTLVCGLTSVLFSQEPYQIWMEPEDNHFEIIQQQVEEYFQDKDKGRGSGYKQWKRWEYLNQHRLSPEGKITNTTARNWEAYFDYHHDDGNKNGIADNKSNGYWSQLGPTSFTFGSSGYNGGLGRVNVIAFHPTLPGTIFVGTPSGGLWKTEDYGTSWLPLTDGMPQTGVSGIAINHSNPEEIYLLTGDGDGRQTYSIGVLKSTNGGVTWNYTALTWNVDEEMWGYKLVMHPTNPDILLAAMKNRVYRTSDGGTTWVEIISNKSIFDLEFKPGYPDIVYAASANSVFRSGDAGLSWSESIILSASCDRAAIAVSPDNPQSLYYLAGGSESSGTFVGFYYSANNGLTFTQTTNSPNILASNSVGAGTKTQAWYDLALAISPSNAAIVLSGGVNLWKSINWGYAFTLKTHWSKDSVSSLGLEYTHPDIHELVYNPLDNALYCGSDGGIFRSTDHGESWTDISAGLCIMQFYKIAGTENNANLIIGGSQDNGSNRWTGSTNMVHYDGADGMDCMIDPTNSSVQYHSRQYGTLRKSINGGVTFDSIYPTYGPWVTNFVMDPNNSSIIYASYSHVYKTIDGGNSWVELDGYGGGPIAVGTNNSNQVYAVNQAGYYFSRSNDGGNSWLGTNNPNDITSIAVDPNDAQHVFVSIGGYNEGEKVYESIDAGSSWTNISGSLPNVPVNCIVFENTGNDPVDAVYIGTDIGIFYRNDNLDDWVPFQNGLPVVPVYDLEINYSAGLLRAGTFGRGLWSSPLFQDCPNGYYLTKSNDPSNPNYTGIQHYEAADMIKSSRVITGGVGTDVTYQAGNSITLTQGFHALESNKFNAVIAPCTGAKKQSESIQVTGSLELYKKLDDPDN